MNALIKAMFLALVASIAAEAEPLIQFEEVSQAAGVADVNSNTAGAAFGDYDNDGDADIYVSSSDSLPSLRNRLYENDGTGKFTDVAAMRGVQNAEAIGRGLSWGDYDNDGDIDLVIANKASHSNPQVPPTTLFKNLLIETGEPNFENVTRAANLMRAGNHEDEEHGGIWGSAAGIGWADYNNDGLLDIHYRNADSDVDNALFKNNGDGTFTDVTQQAGIGILDKVLFADSQGSPGWFDFDQDGAVDLLEGNEGDANTLFQNNGDGTFTDITRNLKPPSGIAFLNPGNTNGTCIGDIDNDGDMDVYLSLADQANRLIRNDLKETGTVTFTDITLASGAGDKGGARGCTLADFDNDRYLDIYVSNGSLSDALVNDIDNSYSPYVQYYVAVDPGLNVLYRNNGNATFTDITEESGADGYGVGTGVAAGDVNGDGFPDIFATNRSHHKDGKPIHEVQQTWLFLNKGNDNSWIKVKLIGTKSNRTGYNARVTVTAGELSQTRELVSTTGYNSADDPTLIFGLGRRNQVDRIEVTWPSGIVQILDNPESEQTVIIEEAS